MTAVEDESRVITTVADNLHTYTHTHVYTKVMTTVSDYSHTMMGECCGVSNTHTKYEGCGSQGPACSPEWLETGGIGRKSADLYDEELNRWLRLPCLTSGAQCRRRGV